MIQVSAQYPTQPAVLDKGSEGVGAGQSVGGVGGGVESQLSAELSGFGEWSQQSEGPGAAAFLHMGQERSDFGIGRCRGAQHVDQSNDSWGDVADVAHVEPQLGSGAVGRSIWRAQLSSAGVGRWVVVAGDEPRCGGGEDGALVPPSRFPAGPEQIVAV